MLIIGKTSEENLTSLTIMPSSCALIGKQEPSLVNMKKVVNYKQLALKVMDGRNRNFIP